MSEHRTLSSNSIEKKVITTKKSGFYFTIGYTFTFRGNSTGFSSINTLLIASRDKPIYLGETRSLHVFDMNA